MTYEERAKRQRLAILDFMTVRGITDEDEGILLWVVTGRAERWAKDNEY